MIAGKEKGREGKVLRYDHKSERVVVEGVHMITKHTKQNAKNPNGGILRTEGSIHASNVMYLYKGEPVRIELTLRFRPSNLNNGTGYYYFVCPVTGLSCRKLYLVEGKFVGRQAFRPLYRAQTESRRERTGFYTYFNQLARLEEMEAQPYRRYTYRGKPTPFARRVDKLASRLDVFADNIAGTIRRKGWGALN